MYMSLGEGLSRKNFFGHVLNYLPGVIILIFGMLALHSSIRMMEDHKKLLHYYKTESHDILYLEANYHEFETAILNYLNHPSPAGQKKVQDSFDLFEEEYFNKVKDEIARTSNVSSEEFLRTLQDIKVDLAAVSAFISILKDKGSMQQSDAFFEKLHEVHEKIERLWAILYSQGLEQKSYQFITSRESMLYWSVIAVSLSGFVLILLNTDKLLRLKTASVERQNTLKLLENRLAAMESTIDGIAIVDEQGVLTYMNNSLIKIHGFDPETAQKFIGEKWASLYGENARLEIDDEIMPELEEAGYWYDEFPIVQQDGQIINTELVLTRLVDGGFIATVRDITEKQKADKERQELEAQFYQAQKMEAVGRLAGGIAHDFNNILAAMNGYAEFLIDDLEEGSSEHKFAKNILQAGQQARDLVDQMLAFSRRKEGHTELFDLNIPLKESVSMLDASFPKTVEVETDIELSKAPVDGNSTQISQVIMNLCVNARDAMEEDRGHLKIGLKEVGPEEYEDLGMIEGALPALNEAPPVKIEDVEPGKTRLILSFLARNQNYVCLSIRDTGCGMSRVIMEHIFEPFFTTKAVDKGTGLGLATVHGVVAGHQGAMIIESTIGKGTSFEILFPVAEAETKTKTEEEAAEEVLEITAGDGLILLVEDQQEVSDMMLAMLERLGYEAELATDGLQALAILRENPGAFDLVVTDQNMPKMTGLELITQTSLDFPDLPFIIVSGYSQQKLDGLEGEHESIKAVLRKPVKREVLAREIAKVMASQKPQEAVA